MLKYACIVVVVTVGAALCSAVNVGPLDLIPGARPWVADVLHTAWTAVIR
jgi:hypothetical protein